MHGKVGYLDTSWSNSVSSDPAAATTDGTTSTGTLYTMWMQTDAWWNADASRNVL